jgi:hypothetical protein
MKFMDAYKALKPHVYYYQFGKIHFTSDGVEKRLSPSAIVFLSQLMYWNDKKTSELGVYKTREEWEDELGISSRRIDSAREELVKAGLITETKTQFPVTIYYKLNEDVLETYIEQILSEGFVSIECEEEKPIVQKPSEGEVPEDWKPSANLVKFRKELFEKTNEYAQTDFFNASGVPTKYWFYVDGYIDALIKGEFVARFGKHFTKKVKELPAMSFDELVAIAASVKVLKSKGKPNVNDIFWVYGGKFSRFVNKYYKDKPSLPELDPVKVAKWREAYPYIDQEGYGLTQLYGKIKGLTKEWDWAYYIADKVENFYDDDQMASLKDLGKTMTSNQRKAFVKLWLEAYRGYLEQCKKWKKDPKWETLEEWVADTKVGESRIMSPWYLTAAYIYRTRGWWIIDSKSAQEAIKKFIESSNKNKGDW